MSNYERSKKVGSLRLIDPDPFSVASVAIAAVSAITNFLMLWRGWNAGRQPTASLDDAHRQQLSSLEAAVEKLASEMRQVTRAIERGSPDPDIELYEAPLRVGGTQMHLELAEHQEFARSLSHSYTALGAVHLWVNHIVRQSPGLAARIGSQLDGGLERAIDVINRAMHEGGPTRIVLAESRLILEDLARVIEAELSSRN